MYVAVKGGETAVKNACRLVDSEGRGDRSIPEISTSQIISQLRLSVDRVMAEGSLYDPELAAAAIRQAQGDLVEAVFLVRAFRTTLKRFGNTAPVDTEKMLPVRRISGIFKDIPGGQLLGPTFDYKHRLIEFGSRLPEEEERSAAIKRSAANPEKPVRVTDILQNQGLMEPTEKREKPAEEDLTREPLKIPASRSLRLQNLARGDEGFLLGSAYSLQRGFGLDRHPFLGELRVGFVEIFYTPPELGIEICTGRIKVTECCMVSRTEGSENENPGFRNGYGLTFGQNERKAMSMSLLDSSLKAGKKEDEEGFPAQDQEFILCHSDNVESSGFVQHLKLPHYVDFQSELVFIRNLIKEKKNDSCKEERNQEADLESQV